MSTSFPFASPILKVNKGAASCESYCLLYIQNKLVRITVVSAIFAFTFCRFCHFLFPPVVLLSIKCPYVPVIYLSQITSKILQMPSNIFYNNFSFQYSLFSWKKIDSILSLSVNIKRSKFGM